MTSYFLVLQFFPKNGHNAYHKEFLRMLLYSKFRASIKLLSIILPSSSITPLKWPYLDTIMVKERSSKCFRAGQVTIGMKS